MRRTRRWLVAPQASPRRGDPRGSLGHAGVRLNPYFSGVKRRVRGRWQRMGTITSSDGTEIFYKDWGSGQPIVFSHGWPLSGDDWDTQMLFFLQHGHRVIAHDRRGHGRSTQTGDVDDMDHYPDDMAV